MQSYRQLGNTQHSYLGDCEKRCIDLKEITVWLLCASSPSPRGKTWLLPLFLCEGGTLRGRLVTDCLANSTHVGPSVSVPLAMLKGGGSRFPHEAMVPACRELRNAAP